MCGIAGIVDPDREVDPDVVTRMCAAIRHRGPDERGFHVESHAVLGMQRLAIVDLAGGQQPVYNEARDVAVVMNGEIYNHEALRADLERRGHRLGSHADTEVLVHLYEEHGAGLARHLRGMFAFAIWDLRRRRLVLGRDRVGKKPLYWTRDPNGRLSFASEIQGLLQDPGVPRDVDFRALDAYLLLQYVPDPLTAFRGVHKLPPAHTLVLDVGREPVIEPYWRLDYADADVPVERADRIAELRRLLDEATSIRLMGEVPLGAFLSGGIDSTAVVEAMARTSSGKVRTYAIGFADASFDESGYAREVAEYFGTEHTEFIVEPEALSLSPMIARHHGEPFADPAAIPTFQLARLTSEQVTVALNGDGGDESFAGYGRHARGLRIGRADWLPPAMQSAAARAAAPLLERWRHRSSLASRAHRLSRVLAQPPWGRYLTSLAAWDADQRDALRGPVFTEALAGWRGEDPFMQAWVSSTAPTAIERMLDTDLRTYLPGDLLPKVDIATMAYSLEARSPFLDHHLMEYAARLPASDKLDGSVGKLLLKEALRGSVPDTVLDRPKMGFGVPLDRWFREDLRDHPGEVLLDPRSIDRGWLRRDTVEKMIAEHHDGTAQHGMRLWVLVQLETWAREVLDAPAAVYERPR